MKYGSISSFILFLSCIFLCCKNAPALSLDDFAYSDEWLALVHYQKKLSGYKSTVDSKNFFLHKDGKYNPEAELEATLDLFASNQDDKKCEFPARYKLLKKQGFIDYEFPKCSELEQFYDDLQPDGITLLFTDSYMNNPSSLFGHTLIRIDTKRKGTQLIAHGANYGAFTGNDGGVTFAILGLTGGYFGGFTVKPYYDIINTYNNIENRDIWEFKINFSEEEKDLFVAHLWEMGKSQSRYFFFSRNCSYMLMEMFDAVRPSLKLADRFPVYAIPLDTLKAAAKDETFIKEINYRPSRQNKIIHRKNSMIPEERKYLSESIKNPDYDYEKIPAEMRADVLETTYQYVQYQYVAKKMELADYRAQSFKALKGIHSGKKGRIRDIKEGKLPTKAHDSMRMEVSAGSKHGGAFQEVAYRPAYHSLTDNDYGLRKGSEINFLNGVVRNYDRENKYVLQRFDVVHIKSYSPIDELFTPISFDISFDLKREENPANKKEGYALNLYGGAGGAIDLGENLRIYEINRGYMAYGGFLPHSSYLGTSVAIGVLADVFKLKIQAEAEKVFATSHYGEKTRYKSEAAYSLSRNLALSAKYTYEHNYGKNFGEFSVGIRFYFYD